jgi:hypothetical protein
MEEVEEERWLTLRRDWWMEADGLRQRSGDPQPLALRASHGREVECGRARWSVQRRAAAGAWGCEGGA